METTTFTMYSVKKIFHLPDRISLPLTMYSMKNLHATKNATNGFANLENRQDKILGQLEDLERKLRQMRNKSKPETTKLTEKSVSQEGMLKDVVVKADPQHPPLALMTYYKWLEKRVNIGTQSFVHSSLTTPIDDSLKHYFSNNFKSRSDSRVFLTLIWHKSSRIDPIMIVDPLTQVAIEGEVNILRYLSNFVQNESDALNSTDVDAILDLVHGSVIHGNNKERQSVLRVFNARLGNKKWLSGDSLTVADVAAWAAVKNGDLLAEAPRNVKKWALAVEQIDQS